MKTEQGFLKADEPHPAARVAYQWLKAQPLAELNRWHESFSSCSLSDNRLAEVCAETLRRLLAGEPVSDRYLLGLAWAMRFDPADISKRKHEKGARLC